MHAAATIRRAPDCTRPPLQVLSPDCSVVEVVQYAEVAHADALLFGREVATGVQTLSSTAGPPTKLARYLDSLADLARCRQLGGPATGQLQWLQRRNVACSGEARGVRVSGRERLRRTWEAGGRSLTFNWHLKPSDHVHPDRCVRVYFEWLEERSRFVIGWIGRHP